MTTQSPDTGTNPEAAGGERERMSVRDDLERVADILHKLAHAGQRYVEDRAKTGITALNRALDALRSALKESAP